MPYRLVLLLVGMLVPVAGAAGQGTAPPKPVTGSSQPSTPVSKPAEPPKTKAGSSAKNESKGKASPALPTGEPRLKRRPPAKPDNPAL